VCCPGILSKVWKVLPRTKDEHASLFCPIINDEKITFVSKFFLRSKSKHSSLFCLPIYNKKIALVWIVFQRANTLAYFILLLLTIKILLHWYLVIVLQTNWIRHRAILTKNFTHISGWWQSKLDRACSAVLSSPLSSRQTSLLGQAIGYKCEMIYKIERWFYPTSNQVKPLTLSSLIYP